MNQPLPNNSNSSNNHKPRLSEIKVTKPEIEDWKNSNVTRLFFGYIAELYKDYKEEIPTAYVASNAHATHGRIAELIGGMKALEYILRAENEEEFLVSAEDIQERMNEK